MQFFLEIAHLMTLFLNHTFQHIYFFLMHQRFSLILNLHFFIFFDFFIQLHFEPAILAFIVPNLLTVVLLEHFYFLCELLVDLFIVILILRKDSKLFLQVFVEIPQKLLSFCLLFDLKLKEFNLMLVHLSLRVIHF